MWRRVSSWVRDRVDWRDRWKWFECLRTLDNFWVVCLAWWRLALMVVDGEEEGEEDGGFGIMALEMRDVDL